MAPDDALWRAGLGAHLLAMKNDSGWDYLRDIPHCRRTAPKALLTYGTALLQRKDNSAAQKCLAHLQLVAPYSEQVFLFSAGIDKEKVPQQYRALVALQPHSSVGYSALSEYLIKHNEEKEAVNVMQAELKELPESPPAWRGLGDAYASISQWDEAEKSWSKSLALLMPTDFNQLNELARHEFSILYSGLGTYAYLHKNQAEALKYAQLFNACKFTAVLPWYLSVMQVRPPHMDLKGLALQRKGSRPTRHARRHAVAAQAVQRVHCRIS